MPPSKSHAPVYRYHVSGNAPGQILPAERPTHSRRPLGEVAWSAADGGVMRLGFTLAYRTSSGTQPPVSGLPQIARR